MGDKLSERGLKISEALYRTTDLFPDAEPLKWALRQNAVDILNVQPQDTLRLEALVKGMLVKLELASGGTFISKMNFGVLQREYKGLLDEAVSDRNNYQNLLDKLLLDTPALKQPMPISDISTQDKAKVKLSDRRESLLNALKQSGRASVGDLAKALGGEVSEKTIQREMNVLVMSGKVKQEGDKRWRRYFI